MQLYSIATLNLFQLNGPFCFQNDKSLGMLDSGGDKANEEVHVTLQCRVTPSRHKWYLDEDNFLWTDEQLLPVASKGECKILKAIMLKQLVTY